MHCDVCQDTAYVSRTDVFGTDPVCTCGAGDSELASHAFDCDSVPCPFDQLLVLEEA